MNKEEDYASESDQSDEDFCPNGEASDVASEDESEDVSDEDNNQDGESGKTPSPRKTSGKRNKRPATKRQSKRSKPTASDEESGDEEAISTTRRQTRGFDDTSAKTEKEKDEIVSDEEDKGRSDALWADFLSDVKKPTAASTNASTAKNNISKPSETSSSKTSNGTGSKVTDKEEDKEEKEQTVIKPSPKKEAVANKITEDLAKEETAIRKSLNSDSIKENQATVSKPTPPRIVSPAIKRPAIGGGGGLGSLLDQIGKKKKVSVLEKSKLDWNSFKASEGIEEELQTFNKGKDGYLERQDFLQRTDLRQFEIEKSLRQTRRHQ